MSDPSASARSSTSFGAPNVLKPDNPRSDFQTTLPSDIVRRGVDRGASGSVYSTLRGSKNRSSRVVPEKESLPKGWKRVAHPDSGVYYVNKKNGWFTSSDMLDPRINSLITKGANELLQSAAMKVVLEDDKSVHLVLDIQRSSSGSGAAKKLCYYCVSHAEPGIFWLEDFGQAKLEVPCISRECPKPTSRAHCIQAQYWKHCELFPTSLTVTKDITRELKDTLLQASADRLLVKFSTSPYDKDDLAYMLDLVKEVEGEGIPDHLVTSDAVDVGEGSGHSAWVIARFMALYVDGVLQSSFGQSDDFFDIENTGSIGPYKRHPLLVVIAIPFIRTPDVYAFELHSFHESFTLARWSDFVRKVDQSIRDSNLLATVLLSTNVGFLSWSDGSQVSDVNKPNAAQIVSYISTICSVGSIIIGLAIYKQYRATGADTPLRAVVVLRRILKEPLGLERLAIICSLPYVLLMWGLIAFLASFIIVFYQDTGIGVRIPVSLVLFLVAFFLFFCMYTGAAHNKEIQKRPKTLRENTDISDEKV